MGLQTYSIYTVYERGEECEWWLDRGNRPKETGETVDRRQNNGSVKAVSPRHCPATCALRNCCFNCCAWAESQCPLHCCCRTTWTTRSKRGPTCSVLFGRFPRLSLHALSSPSHSVPVPNKPSRFRGCKTTVKKKPVAAWELTCRRDLNDADSY